MTFKIEDKGTKFDIQEKSTQEGPGVFYMGAGWDNPNGPVDLDLVATLKSGSEAKHLVYFGERTAPGVLLSEDNTTGEGDGDDESIVINTAEIPADIDSVEIGLAAYSGGADMKNAPNAHFRVCDGDNESSPEIAEINFGESEQGQTVLHACRLVRDGDKWVLENVAEFHAKGNGIDSIQGFAAL